MATEIHNGIDKYLAFKAAEGAKQSYIDDLRIRLGRFFDDCGIDSYRMIDESKFIAWFVASSEIDPKTGRSRRSARTRRLYRQAVGQFVDWLIARMVVDLTSNPINATPRVRNSKKDVRKKRRALTEDEIHRLLRMARLRPTAEYGRKSIPRGGNKRSNWSKIAVTYDELDDFVAEARSRLARNRSYLAKLDLIGQERELIYRVLITTGLRRNELASLQASQCVLDDCYPRIELNADDEKAGRGASIPIPDDLAGDLRSWIQSHMQSSTSKLFRVPQQLVKTLNRDLKACNIEKIDARGRSIDIHALRHTHATRLCNAGINPKIAQQAMRHSSIQLTMDVYSHVQDGSVRQAVNSLPALGAIAAKRGFSSTSRVVHPDEPDFKATADQLYASMLTIEELAIVAAFRSSKNARSE